MPQVGYTTGMKTAVSIPDDVFDEAEAFRRVLRRRRSDVYTSALREYLANHSPERVTETLNRVYQNVSEDTSFVDASAHLTLEHSEW